MMINCHKASTLASESLDHPLTLIKRFSLRFHLLICRFCRRYLRQVRFIHEALSLADEETKLSHSSYEIRLSPNARNRIKERV